MCLCIYFYFINIFYFSVIIILGLSDSLLAQETSIAICGNLVKYLSNDILIIIRPVALKNLPQYSFLKHSPHRTMNC